MVHFPVSLMIRFNQTESAVFQLCRLSVFSKDPLFRLSVVNLLGKEVAWRMQTVYLCGHILWFHVFLRFLLLPEKLDTSVLFNFLFPCNSLYSSRIKDIQSLRTLLLWLLQRQWPEAIYEPPHDKTNKIACAPSEDSDQPGHPPSLIRVYAVRM